MAERAATAVQKRAAAGYRGRFAPSPTGPLHMGSLVTALASWLDARAHGGQWLVRIEDIDTPRCVRDADHDILHTLERVGMTPDEPPVWQSRREPHYAEALRRLDAAAQLYPCGCSRKEIADSLVHVRERHQTLGYPGTCRHGLNGKLPRAWRVRVPDGPAAVVCFDDRWQGRQCQNLETELGDFVLRRADGLWAYQLAVVVDDGLQGITHIVRGADLLDSTPRQIHLQHLLGLSTPAYLHVPVVVNQLGEKLSKQSGAQAIDTTAPLDALREAGAHLGLSNAAGTVQDWLARATDGWRERLASLPLPARR
ncbi:putative glutamyl t-RNA synthetase with nucleotidylyl transferase domain [Cupriavidus taiwanensis]|uniref:tRNA glutamyl-Q(34) synthetase GluQRS n=1 Tax=Cupriavidus taiwanensis TaxID=164546 RepID=UPI000E13CCCD|nr:tRNA glutamyl-Q(34) synthetase GluQRS [Cupriavidus taiwanensis]SOZ98304.1 putative glutamyl t-RNA synthetase with nucleotidylyl transferase domain [Cupriavidus taiwanensis]SPA17342.1 putative glutamyl t-RNA synthetase with nucleotidylyl transferase domain [Cupriavidus taiwanensis]